MDITEVVITAIASAVAAGISAYFTYKGVKAKADADAETEAKTWAVERQRILAEAGSVDIAAIRGIAEAARDYALELKERVDELEKEVESERQLRRKLEAEVDAVNRRFAALCQWVRSQGLDVNGFLTQLEAGAQGG